MKPCKLDESELISNQRLEEAFGGKYKVGEVIGKGAFGTVRKLVCRQSHRKYAVKVTLSKS